MFIVYNYNITNYHNINSTIQMFEIKKIIGKLLLGLLGLLVDNLCVF